MTFSSSSLFEKLHPNFAILFFFDSMILIMILMLIPFIPVLQLRPGRSIDEEYQATNQRRGAHQQHADQPLIMLLDAAPLPHQMTIVLDRLPMKTEEINVFCWIESTLADG